MHKAPFISICILSYNRPETLTRLLHTLDTKRVEDIEIVICEDHSPRQREIREAVHAFQKQSPYQVIYFENEKNLGYDGTLNQLVKRATGTWIVFMGDDDEFVPNAFDKVATFLKEHSDLGYVMKSHYTLRDYGQKELFRYFNGTTFFEPGMRAYTSLFRRSVFIAGFAIRREYALPFVTDIFDGTMLMQIYLLAEVVLKYPSAYFDEPFTQQYASHAHNIGDTMFDREKKKFVPRKPTIDISINFLKSFYKITEFMDDKYHFESTALIKRDMSKYFYPSLAVHRDEGLRFFFRYVRELNKLGFNITVYYYLYVVLLTVLGRRICDWGIYMVKKILGRTPQL